MDSLLINKHVQPEPEESDSSGTTASGGWKTEMNDGLNRIHLEGLKLLQEIKKMPNTHVFDETAKILEELTKNIQDLGAQARKRKSAAGYGSRRPSRRSSRQQPLRRRTKSSVSQPGASYGQPSHPSNSYIVKRRATSSVLNRPRNTNLASAASRSYIPSTKNVTQPRRLTRASEKPVVEMGLKQVMVPVKSQALLEAEAKHSSLELLAHARKFFGLPKETNIGIIRSAIVKPDMTAYRISLHPDGKTGAILSSNDRKEIVKELRLGNQRLMTRWKKLSKSGGMNLELWYLSLLGLNKTKDTLVMDDLVIKLTRSGQFLNEIENLTKHSDNHPDLLYDDDLMFPIRLMDVKSTRGPQQLFVMRKANGRTVGEFLGLTLALRPGTSTLSPGSIQAIRYMFRAVGTVLGNFHKRYGNLNHCDFHISNVFYEERTRKATIIDLGGMGQKVSDTDVEHFTKAINLIKGSYPNPSQQQSIADGLKEFNSSHAMALKSPLKPVTKTNYSSDLYYASE